MLIAIFISPLISFTGSSTLFRITPPGRFTKNFSPENFLKNQPIRMIS